MKLNISAQERIRRGVTFTPAGCWEWQNSRDKHGYGRMTLALRSKLAHRVSYEAFVGPIPVGLQIDHLCRNRCCVNPDHLEAVLPIENWARGVSLSVDNARKTCCPAGHALAGANLYLLPNGHRGCKACRSEASAQYRLRKGSR